MDKEKAPDTKAQIYVFLKVRYELEPDLPFVPGPEPHHELTAQEFDQGMFQLAKKGIQAPNESSQHKAMVTMRQMVSLNLRRSQNIICDCIKRSLIERIQAPDESTRHKAMVTMRQKVTLNQSRIYNLLDDYIKGSLIDYCFEEIKQDRSQKVRYEALLILDTIVGDSGLYGYLIFQKNCIQVFLDFLGKEDHTLIRNKAKQVLRKIICQLIQVTLKIKKKSIIAELIPKLQTVEKRIQAREIIWIIQRVQNMLILQNQEVAIKACSIFCEAIKSNIFQSDHSPGSDLDFFLQGLRVVPSLNKKTFLSCISQYKIMGQLMNYAQLGEYLSRHALVVLGSFTDELVKNDDFFDLALKLIEKPKKIWPTLPELYKILQEMTEKYMDTLLSKQKLLRSLTKLITQNKESLKYQKPLQNKEHLSREQQQKIKTEEDKRNAIPQMAVSVCDIYLTMIQNRHSKIHQIIFELISSQNISLVASMLFGETSKNVQLGWKTIKGILVFLGDKKSKKLNLNICEQLKNLEILPMLKYLEKKQPLKEKAKQMLKQYFPEEDNKGKLDKLDKQDKDYEDDYQGNKDKDDNVDKQDKQDKQGNDDKDDKDDKEKDGGSNRM